MSEPRKRGRQPLYEGRMEHTSIRLPKSLTDDLCRLAVRDQVSVTSLAREAIRLFVCSKNRQAEPEAPD